MFAIDHLVLPTVTLDVARHRLSKLGFTVAADANHPFGTGNACVFMADGTYLEPLSVVDAAAYEAAVGAGNVFVRQDRDFRVVSGADGLSAMALATDDAAVVHEMLGDAGVSGGDMLEFSRMATLPDGSQKLARFRLAFAARGDGDSFRVFSCQRLDALPADRSALERHDNGVLALSQVILVSHAAEASMSQLAAVLSTDVAKVGHGGCVFNGRNLVVRILEPEALAGEFGLFDDTDINLVSGLAGAAIVFRVGDLAVTRSVLAANDVPFVNRANRIVVAAAPGQGVVFAFEE